MKKVLVGAILATSLTGMASAEGWTLLAGAKDDYQMLPTLSAVVGSSMPTADGAESTSLVGVELSMNCPLIQPPTNRIRQQVSWTMADDAGTTTHSIEMNPHYVVPVAENFEVGFGPGFGVVLVETASVSKTLFGAQLGASAHYRMGAFFVGGEARYQLTNEADFGSGDMNLNNNRVLLKIGMDI